MQRSFVKALIIFFIFMTIPFRCAEGTKRHETGASLTQQSTIC